MPKTVNSQALLEVREMSSTRRVSGVTFPTSAKASEAAELCLMLVNGCKTFNLPWNVSHSIHIYDIPPPL